MIKCFANFIIILASVLTACVKDKNAISFVVADNPPEELSWMEGRKSTLTNCTCQTSIFKGKYKNETVFFVMMNDPLCNSVFDVVLCNGKGKVVKHYEYSDFNDYCREVTEVKCIYTCRE